MVDEQTGLPFTSEKLELAMREAHESIITDGFNKMKPGATFGGKSLALRNQDHRFFVFRNADAWMEYQEKFGNPNPFDAMMGHIDMMSRDIAIMEVLGPNPRATVNFVKQTLQKDAAGNQALERSARKATSSIDALYSSVTGDINAPVDSRIGYTFAGIRQILQSAQLGAASISAVTDMNFGRIARSMVGLPQTKNAKEVFRFDEPSWP